ncbi:MAG: shikimate dehydrogenase [Candidatus Saccharibacteria bacterium]
MSAQHLPMEMNINSATELFGVIGYPLGHSLSPLMHNEAFHELAINALYLAWAVSPENLPKVVDAAKTLNVRGFNVTIPFKEKIISYLDGISDEAAACGAVNTVKITNGQAWGYNTDGPGFLASLQEREVQIGGMALVLGAGGAARAIGYELAKAGYETAFVDIVPEKAATLATDIKRLTGSPAAGVVWNSSELTAVTERAALIVNASPVGMYPNVQNMPPLDLNGLTPGAVVCDIVYNPIKTRLLLEAEALGIKTVEGLGMFINQGAIAFKIFTGVDAPVKVMENAVRKSLKRN